MPKPHSDEVERVGSKNAANTAECCIRRAAMGAKARCTPDEAHESKPTKPKSCEDNHDSRRFRLAVMVFEI
jgi:hypothetical protein